MPKEIFTKKEKKFFKIIGIIIITPVALVTILVGGFLLITGIMHADQHAKIELTDEYYLTAELKLKDFPGQALVLWLCDQDGNFLDSQNIDEIIGGRPIDYVESRNKSWKEIKLISDENGIKTFEAIWGDVILDTDGEITVKWNRNSEHFNSNNYSSNDTITSSNYSEHVNSDNNIYSESKSSEKDIKDYDLLKEEQKYYDALKEEEAFLNEMENRIINAKTNEEKVELREHLYKRGDNRGVAENEYIEWCRIGDNDKTRNEIFMLLSRLNIANVEKYTELKEMLPVDTERDYLVTYKWVKSELEMLASTTKNMQKRKSCINKIKDVEGIKKEYKAGNLTAIEAKSKTLDVWNKTFD